MCTYANLICVMVSVIIVACSLCVFCAGELFV